MNAFERTLVENETAKKHILEINEEHPHYVSEAMDIFRTETTWGRRTDVAVIEAYDYLKKNDDLYEDALESGNDKEADMYGYIHKLIYADFCQKHTKMEEAFCIWSHDVLGWNLFERFGIENPFSEIESEK